MELYIFNIHINVLIDFKLSSVTSEEFEDTEGIVRIRKSMKNRQHYGQKKRDKQRSTQHTHTTKDRVTRIPLKTGGELMCSGRIISSCSTRVI